MRRPRRPTAGLVAVLAGASALVFATPAAYVAWRSLTMGVDGGELWRDVRAPLWRTVQLSVTASLGAGGLGTALAWLLVSTDVPLRRFWRVVVAVPIVFPSFVGAAAILASLSPTGIARQALEAVGYHPPARFRGLGASWLVLTLFTYPYVYLAVSARLARMPASFEASARLLGDRPARFFGRVVWPFVRSSTLGGMLVVFLYSLSEFGAVQLLGYDTLTRVVYATRLVDRAQSFGAAAVLLVLALAVVTIEHRMRGDAFLLSSRVERAPRPVPLGRWRAPATAAVVAVVVAALVVPLASMVQWAWRGIRRDGEPVADLGRALADLGDPALATTLLSVAAAALTVAFVLPAAVVSARSRGLLSRTVNAAVLCGFAVPGIVIALSLVFFSLNVPVFDRLYQTVPLLLGASVVHFGSQAMRPVETAVTVVPDHLRESARLLGAGWARRAVTVHVPLMRPSLLAGGGLVLLATLKELPATLLLAPTGLDTLAVRVWQTFEEGFFAEAAIAGMGLVVLSALLTWLLVLRRVEV